MAKTVQEDDMLVNEVESIITVLTVHTVRFTLGTKATKIKKYATKSSPWKI